MRLLSAKGLFFKEFPGDKIPKYAILSHRWEGEEPSYSDMKTRVTHRDADVLGAGPLWTERNYRKIYQFGLMASQAGYEYIWVDTCCIDKSSSTELQESINSMCRWYMESGVCYAYLSDVTISADVVTHKTGSAGSKPWTESFQNSQWFTRGWTLQELLAPRELIFYDKNWHMCGNRVELQDAIQAATGIDGTSLIKASYEEGAYLRSLRSGRLFTWAASRQTTRCEDRAYSLLGMFNVNMPLLYGEKDRAFYRLQEEVIKVNEDNECVRFSDPIYVPSRFVNEAKPEPTCFIRHTEAAHLYEPGDGLSLGLAVWNNYTTTFTYPVQAQAGRRHFPALLGRFPKTPKQNGNDYSFIVELAARTDPKRRYVIIVEYWASGTTITNITTTVKKLRWPINLVYAMKLLQRRQVKLDFKSHKLPDAATVRTRQDLEVRTIGVTTRSFAK
ncbi:het-domain protein [Fusarium subglutinans]|uniref:Het-domain protein n=1 Tax=Gibberella subglutinans TaxID=42677 RepID=A0A8H5L5T4_GIBSU|nr:het-domain protein [Fusarium subglutinans]KAF5585259.1 het-domain protein [Fusarium subglutinans]